MPAPTHSDLAGYMHELRADCQKGYWFGADAYLVSMLKEYFGDAATPDNGLRVRVAARINGDHGTYRTVMDMIDGSVFGYFLLGQNPAVGSAHGKLQRLGMANLDWLVVRDLAMIESATFWKDSPEIETGEIVTERCRTEVFFFPAASHVEKEGTFTQTSACCSGGRRPSSQTVTSAPSCGSFYHLDGWSGRSWPTRQIPGTRRCTRWPGTTGLLGADNGADEWPSPRPRTCCAGSAAWSWARTARCPATPS